MKRTLEFTDQELNVLLLGLQKLPWDVADPVIRAVVNQLQPNAANIPIEKETSK
jgi:hypothetical protein